jgi:hypothetical protein
MSWLDELAAQAPRPFRVARDLSRAWRGYRAAGLPLPRCAAFTCLCLVQRTAYWVGWTTQRLRGSQ